MGYHKNIQTEKFPRQSSHLGKSVKVCFNYDRKEFFAKIIRDDAEDPYKTIFLLDDGRVVTPEECQYSLPFEEDYTRNSERLFIGSPTFSFEYKD